MEPSLTVDLGFNVMNVSRDEGIPFKHPFIDKDHFLGESKKIVPMFNNMDNLPSMLSQCQQFQSRRFNPRLQEAYPLIVSQMQTKEIKGNKLWR